MWRPRGERGLSSCRSRFITLARASPRRRGLRSRGAGSPMTNVPVSRQQAPPGPATPSAQQVPGECLRVSVSGKELLKAQSLQKGYKDSSASSSPPSPCRRHRKRNPQPGGWRVAGEKGGTPSEFSGTESAVRAAGFLLLSLPPLDPSPPPAQRTGPRNRRWGWRGAASRCETRRERVQAGRPGPGSVPGLDRSPSASTRPGPPERAYRRPARVGAGTRLAVT